MLTVITDGTMLSIVSGMRLREIAINSWNGWIATFWSASLHELHIRRNDDHCCRAQIPRSHGLFCRRRVAERGSLRSARVARAQHDSGVRVRGDWGEADEGAALDRGFGACRDSRLHRERSGDIRILVAGRSH